MGAIAVSSATFVASIILAFVLHACIAIALLRELDKALQIKLKNVTRLSHTRSLITVNGKFPGPKIVAREGDRVIVKVVNLASNNVTIHSTLQLHNSGPGQRGTLFWHADISWLRVTLYGPLVILPKIGVPYPFAKPYKEVPITFDTSLTEAVIAQEALQFGGSPNVSDANTINGFPGPLYNITNHSFTIVEVDTIYVKPFTTKTLFITPGKTTNVLLHTLSSIPSPFSLFLIVARPYATGLGTFDNTTTSAVLQYQPNNLSTPQLPTNHTSTMLFKPVLPALNDTAFASNFTSRLRSLASPQFPVIVPHSVDKKFFFIVSLITNPCPKNQTCQGPNDTKFAASVNNVSFSLPASSSLLQAHFFGKSKGVYTTYFPVNPLFSFNYTGTPPNNTCVSNGTKVVVLPFNAIVELVLQDTSIQGIESHPLLPGFNFFVVGTRFGNYNPSKDPAKFNLVDPVERNTVGVLVGGWVAIRFFADNPVCDRCMVHALPLGGTYELGVEDGMGGAGWATADPEAASSTVRSSQVLTIDFCR
ncbi:hypothetical protein KFK09_021573 [Dendrobium nobile]|uniref:Laccase n=1 Tax=Dendrobium nobile TaxID=94219 RepID=A0A8T3ARI9_DENNO|nr:hypothetical protein KFK09_021573 [Dendrobium nobile]